MRSPMLSHPTELAKHQPKQAHRIRIWTSTTGRKMGPVQSRLTCTPRRSIGRCAMRCIATFASTALILLQVPACVGGAQIVLKSPIHDQCTSAGLSGCEDIAEGATLYADGHPDEGHPRLARGLRSNATKAAELKKFADGLELVGKVQGAGQYVAPLQPAIKLVQQTAAEAAALKALEQPSPSVLPSAPAIAVPARLARATERQAITQPWLVSSTSESRTPEEQKPLAPPVATFWLPTGNTLAVACRFAGTPKMLCLIERIDSPRQVTDLIVSPACPVDVLVSCRHGLENDWVVYAPAGKGADIHGAALPITTRQSLTIAIAQKSDDALPDIRCGVSAVWHEVHETRPEKTPQQIAAEAIPDESWTDRPVPPTRVPGF